MSSSSLSVLVVGFSVTAANPGYVEMARLRPDWPPGVALERVAIGGAFIHQLKFIIAEILSIYRPDLVVLEVATTGIRNFGTEAGYRSHLDPLLAEIAAAGAGVAFLDLPRLDVDPVTDWVMATHRRAAEEHGLAYDHVPLVGAELLDLVHPTPDGHRRYAKRLSSLVRGAVATLAEDRLRLHGALDARPEKGRYRSLRASRHSLARTKGFSRTGLMLDMLPLAPGAPLSYLPPAGWHFAGVTHLIGPKTGALRLSLGDRTKTVPGYDVHAYYNRLAFALLPEPKAGVARIEQLPDLPQIVPLKGTPDTGPRLGHIGHYLLQRAD